MNLIGQNALVTGISRGIGRGIVDWAGDAICAFVEIARRWRKVGGRIHEPGRREDDAGLAGDDDVTLSRTIRWSDGRNEMLLWKLPSPGA